MCVTVSPSPSFQVPLAGGDNFRMLAIFLTAKKAVRIHEWKTNQFSVPALERLYTHRISLQTQLREVTVPRLTDKDV